MLQYSNAFTFPEHCMVYKYKNNWHSPSAARPGVEKLQRTSDSCYADAEARRIFKWHATDRLWQPRSRSARSNFLASCASSDAVKCIAADARLMMKREIAFGKHEAFANVEEIEGKTKIHKNDALSSCHDKR